MCVDEAGKPECGFWSDFDINEGSSMFQREISTTRAVGIQA